MEYYSALKRKETLTHAPTWMNLEDLMPSAISQPQIYEAPGGVIFIKAESRTVVARDWGGGSGGLVFDGYGISTGEDGDGCTM